MSPLESNVEQALVYTVKLHEALLGGCTRAEALILVEGIEDVLISANSNLKEVKNDNVQL